MHRPGNDDNLADIVAEAPPKFLIHPINAGNADILSNENCFLPIAGNAYHAVADDGVEGNSDQVNMLFSIAAKLYITISDDGNILNYRKLP